VEETEETGHDRFSEVKAGEWWLDGSISKNEEAA
jgi:hypothetical protein